MHFTIKPVSAACNLKCSYCFYQPKEETMLPRGKMSLETLEQFIKFYIAACPSDHVYFTWQGGEPLLMSQDFYRQAFALQKKYGHGKHIENAIQTNGTLIDASWCQLFKDNQVLLGVSIDGPEHLHNTFRQNRQGHGSFAEVMRGIKLLQQHQVPFNTLTCINATNYQYPLEVYHFLKELGSTFMQFSEVVETTPENSDFDHVAGTYQCREFSVPAQGYGDFMGEIFKEWVAHDIGNIVIRQFESIIARTLGMGHVSCVFEDKCPDNFVLEANGDIYECDQAVYPKYKLATLSQLPNIPFTTTSQDPSATEEVRASLDVKNILSATRLSQHKANLSSECRCCTYLSFCNGGCVKHRIELRNGVPHTYFCAGYKKLFQTMTPYLNTMVYLEENNIPYTQIKSIASKIAAAL